MNLSPSSSSSLLDHAEPTLLDALSLQFEGPHGTLFVFDPPYVSIETSQTRCAAFFPTADLFALLLLLARSPAIAWVVFEGPADALRRLLCWITQEDLAASSGPPASDFTAPHGTVFFFEGEELRVLGQHGSETVFPSLDFRALLDYLDSTFGLANQIAALRSPRASTPGRRPLAMSDRDLNASLLSPSEWQVLVAVHRLAGPASLEEISQVLPASSFALPAAISTLVTRLHRRGLLAHSSPPLWGPLTTSFDALAEAQIERFLNTYLFGDASLLRLLLDLTLSRLSSPPTTTTE